MSCLCFETYTRYCRKTVSKIKIEMDLTACCACRLNALAYIKQVQVNSTFHEGNSHHSQEASYVPFWRSGDPFFSPWLLLTLRPDTSHYFTCASHSCLSRWWTHLLKMTLQPKFSNFAQASMAGLRPISHLSHSRALTFPTSCYTTLLSKLYENTLDCKQSWM